MFKELFFFIFCFVLNICNFNKKVWAHRAQYGIQKQRNLDSFRPMIYNQTHPTVFKQKRKVRERL